MQCNAIMIIAIGSLVIAFAIIKIGTMIIIMIRRGIKIMITIRRGNPFSFPQCTLRPSYALLFPRGARQELSSIQGFSISICTFSTTF